MMWKCNNCGELFEAPALINGEKLCRNCLSANIDDVTDQLEVCECCGEKVLGTGIEGVCHHCEAKLSELWNFVVIDATLITHKDYEATEAIIKEYFMSKWRNEQ